MRLLYIRCIFFSMLLVVLSLLLAGCRFGGGDTNPSQSIQTSGDCPTSAVIISELEKQYDISDVHITDGPVCEGRIAAVSVTYVAAGDTEPLTFLLQKRGDGVWTKLPSESVVSCGELPITVLNYLKKHGICLAQTPLPSPPPSPSPTTQNV